MNEALYRGRSEDGITHYGLLQEGDIFYILENEEFYAVDANTVGLCSDILDVDGNRIFDGDTVVFRLSPKGHKFTGKIFYNEQQGLFYVVYNNTSAIRLSQITEPLKLINIQ